MNDLDLCLEVVSRSRQPLRYIWRWISRKSLEIETWLQRTTNRKWHMGYQMVTRPITSRDLQRCREAVRSAILATAWFFVIYLSVRSSRTLLYCAETAKPIVEILSLSASSISLVFWILINVTKFGRDHFKRVPQIQDGTKIVRFSANKRYSDCLY